MATLPSTAEIHKQLVAVYGTQQFPLVFFSPKEAMFKNKVIYRQFIRSVAFVN
jgi:hypothetical protein